MSCGGEQNRSQDVGGIVHFEHIQLNVLTPIPSADRPEITIEMEKTTAGTAVQVVETS